MIYLKKILKKITIYSFIFLFLFSNICIADEVDSSEEISITDISSEASTTIDNLSSINSRAFVVLDRKSNSIIIGKNEKEKRKMASTTKIMTALVVIEHSQLNTLVEVSKKAAGTGGSRLGLKTGDKITINDLLYGLMLCSGNDAAVCLAETVGGSISGFAQLMNEKAKQLGLNNTNFVTPHGLDEDEHYTTAYELAVLSNHALNNETFSKIVGTETTTISINGYPKTISNTNELLGNLNGVYGIKTGFTNGANRCLVTACKRGDMDIICVVLGADTKNFRTKDSIKLIEYTFKNYQYFDLQDFVEKEFNIWKNNNSNNFTIQKGISQHLDLSHSELQNTIVPMKKSDISSIKLKVSCNTSLNAPIYKDDVIGKIEIICDETVLDSLDILSNTTIREKNVFDYFIELLKNYSVSLNSLSL